MIDHGANALLRQVKPASIYNHINQKEMFKVGQEKKEEIRGKPMANS